MIRYYPKNRIVTNLHTNGDKFSLNGQPYIGPYYQTFDGKSFTGKNPIQGLSQLLSPLSNIEPIGSNVVVSDLSTSYINNRSNSFNGVPFFQPGTLKTPISHFPNPTQSDYRKGYITRYFAKKRNEKDNIIEISREVFESIRDKKGEYDHFLYQVIDVFWKISGPLRDDRTNRQFKIAGIIDTNRRLIESKSKEFSGLKDYIGEDYSKFAISN